MAHLEGALQSTGIKDDEILTERARERGVQIQLQTPGEGTSESKRKNNRHCDRKDGEKIQIETKTVLIATGGYANNKEWIKKYTGLNLDKDLTPHSQRG